jgi:hypothetical protein
MADDTKAVSEDGLTNWEIKTVKILKFSAPFTLVLAFVVGILPEFQATLISNLLPPFDFKNLKPEAGAAEEAVRNFSVLESMANDLKKASATVIWVFFSLFIFGIQVFWFFYLRMKDGMVSTIKDQAHRISYEFRPLVAGLAEVRDRIAKPGKLQKVEIAIFDNLLIYSPLFVAQKMRYFEEEGLQVDFNIIRSDQKIAQAVKTGRCQFGACDPYFCIDGTTASDGKPELRVLMPLAKRLGLQIVGKKSDIEPALTGGDIVIGSYAEGSTTFLAASAFKKWLETSFSARGISAKVSIDARKMDDPCFSSESNLKSAMSGWTFAAVWEPNVSWLIDDPTATFGVVGIPKISSDSSALFLRVFGGERPSGASGFLEQKEWRAWSATGSDSSAAHKCLVSALVTSRNVIEREPELARRIFRAVSRANIHLHALDLVEDEANSNSLWKGLKSAVNHGGSVQLPVLHALVGEMSLDLDRNERGGLIPFVPGISYYSEKHYLEHLRACHKLWLDNGGSRVTADLGTDDNYARFFVKPSEFALRAH